VQTTTVYRFSITEITCSQPEIDETVESNATVADQSWNIGESLVFSCANDSFELVGHNVITCEDNGSWSTQQFPFCRGKFTPYSDKKSV